MKITTVAFWLFLFVALAPGPASSAYGALTQNAKCPICRMPVNDHTRTAYSAERQKGKSVQPTHFCSYSCAHAFHKKRPGSPLSAHDYHTGEPIAASQAWYIVGSSNLTEEVEFGMAPIVVAFKDEKSARDLQARLKDGKVVKGIESVDKHYEK